MTATDEARRQTRLAARAADDKLADDILGLDVSGQLALTDIFLIASAPTERQVGAVTDAILDALAAEGIKPIRREGQQQGRWVLLDFGDFIAHIQHSDEREFYDLQRLWKDCPAVELDLPERDETQARVAEQADEAQRPWWMPSTQGQSWIP